MLAPVEKAVIVSIGKIFTLCIVVGMALVLAITVTGGAATKASLMSSEIRVDDVLLGSKAENVFQRLGSPSNTEKCKSTTRYSWSGGSSVEVSDSSRLVCGITGTTLKIRGTPIARRGDSKTAFQTYLKLTLPEYREYGSNSWPTFAESENFYAIGGYWEDSRQAVRLSILLQSGIVGNIVLEECRP